MIARPVSLRSAALFFLCLSLSATVSAQETTLRTRSNLVLVPTLVKDPQAAIVYGLQSSDFVVEDDDIEQPVRMDEAPEGQPISLVIAIQRGRRASYEFPRMQGLRTMLSPLFELGASRVAVVEFDSQVELTRNFTDREALVDTDLTNLQPGNEGAAILDAVSYSIQLLRNEPEDRQRVLLLISETRDHGSKTKIEDAVAAVGQANTMTYALTFSPGISNILDTGRGTNKDEMHNGVNFLDLAYQAAQAMRKNVPATVTSMTGGEYELFTTRKKFEVRMNDFTNHLHSRYLLSFAPKDPRPGLHQLRVRLKDPSKGTVVARSSYWAEGTVRK
ncbi:MAG TPA: VWA domain-containing protein [Candidatus Sulfotelmatobacter sp.]|nr:VWA domain-containing protein [Candidatus Sulfotelmatobacter sp.]